MSDCSTISIEDAKVEIITVGVQGPRGVPGTTGAIQANHTLNFGDITQTTLLTPLVGKQIIECKVIVETAFDGTNPSISIGDVVDNVRIMDSFEVDLTSVGTYETNPSFSYSSLTNIVLYFTPAPDGTQGIAKIYITVEG